MDNAKNSNAEILIRYTRVEVLIRDVRPLIIRERTVMRTCDTTIARPDKN